MDFKDGAVYEIPPEHVPGVIAAVERQIERIRDQMGKHPESSAEYRGLAHRLCVVEQDLADLHAEFDRLSPAERATTWIKAPERILREGPGRDNWGFLWFRLVDVDEREIFGCWRPPLKRIPEHPCEMLIPGQDTRGLPRPRDKTDEYERYYVSLASIHDNRLPASESITAGVWPHELAESVWSRFSRAQPWGPDRAFIETALNRVQTELEKPHEKSGQASEKNTRGRGRETPATARAAQPAGEVGTEKRIELLRQKALDIGKWMAQRPERKDILVGRVEAFTQAQEAYEQALVTAIKRAERMSWLQNRGNKPGETWRWIYLFDWQVAALDRSNVGSDGLVTVPHGTSSIGFWGENLPFDPLGWMQYYYGADVPHGVRAEPRDTDSIPAEPVTSEDALLCKCALVAVIWDRAPERCSAERLMPEGPLDWPEQIWMAVSLHKATPLNTEDYEKKTTRILLAWEDVKREIDGLLEKKRRAGDNGEKEPRKTTKVEPSLEKRFAFHPGQVLFNGKDLELRTELARGVLKKLVRRAGKVVRYRTLDPDSLEKEASEKLRAAVVAIRARLKACRIRCQIMTIRCSGYCLQETTAPHTPSR